jgi:hypothetical protein
MNQCSKPEISDQLMMALWPEEFPGSMPELQAHLDECPVCREELDILRQLGETLQDRKKDLVDGLSPCPEPDDIFEFALHKRGKPGIQDHIALCSDCAEQASLVREILYEDFGTANVSMSSGEKQLIRRNVLREYGPVPGTFVEKIRDFLISISAIHFPSLAMGAAAAVLIFLVVLPRGSEQVRMMPVFSDVTWKAPETSAPKSMGPAIGIPAREKVDLIILVSPELKLPKEEIDHIYREIDLAARLAANYDFVSQEEIKRALGDTRDSRTASDAARRTQSKTGADYALVFEISRSGNAYSLRGTLFRSKATSATGAISQSGLRMKAIPSRITNMGAELILEAETS